MAPNFAEPPGDIFAASVRKLRLEGDDSGLPGIDLGGLTAGAGEDAVQLGQYVVRQ